MVRDGTDTEDGWKGLDALRFKLREAALLRLCDPEGTWKPEERAAHLHSLIVVADGRGIVDTGKEQRPLRSGSAYIGRPGEFAGLEASGSLDVYVLSFEALSDLPASADRDAPPPALPIAGDVSVASPAALVEGCRLLLADWAEGGALGRFGSQAALLRLLHETMRGFEDRSARDARSAVARTKAHMDRHCERELSVASLAAMANVSPKYYMSLFKAMYGRSAIDYLTERRIERAKRLMVQPGGRLRDIAQSVGYQDEFYFSRKFKQQIGVSPTVYIRNRSRKIASYSYPVTGQLLALQVMPYAAPLDLHWHTYYRRKYDASVAIHLRTPEEGLNWESNEAALIEGRPDLIIGGDWLDSAKRDKLSGMAQSLFIPWLGTDWRSHLRLTAAFVDREREAETWLRSYDANASRSRELARRSVGEDTFLAMYIYRSNCYLCGRRNTGSLLFGDLGLNPAYPFDRIATSEAVEPERLAAYGADRIVLMVFEDAESQATWRALRQSEEWRSLKAVRAGRVYRVHPDPWHDYSAFSHARTLAEAVKRLV